ncbi:MAG: FAD-dependent oxidoreductase [Methanoculleaceae archaeon]
MKKVRIFTTGGCPYCRMTKAFLDRLGIPYVEVDVGSDRDAARELIELTGQRGVPVTVSGDEVIVGFDAHRLREVFGAGEEEPPAVSDLLILGGGPAGLTAGVYCARKLLDAVIVTENIGGQAQESWVIENYMGFRMVSGDELMQKFEEQARKEGIRLELDRVESVVADGGRFIATTASGREYHARSVIVATGRQPRRLGLEDEERLWGRGVSVCATCDAPLYRGRRVAVVGGGNSALTTALEMNRIAASVDLIVRSTVRADEVYRQKYEQAEGITTHLHSEVVAITGDEAVEGVVIRDRETGEETTLPVEGVFIEIGQVPNSDCVQGLVTLNERGEIPVDHNCRTEVPGLFAAGDVTDIHGKQVIIAAGEGAKAALEAFEYLMAGE